MPRFPEHVVIREVGLRDGLQSIRQVVADRTQARVDPRGACGRPARDGGRLLRARAAAAAARRHRRALVAYAKTLPDLFGLRCWVPNLKGAQRALDAWADLLLGAALGEPCQHSLANLRKTPDGGDRRVRADPRGARRERRPHAARRRHWHRIRLHPPGGGRVGTAFGCTIQGAVEPAKVLRCLQGLLDAGADRVSIADTVGYADPAAVRPPLRAGPPHCRREVLLAATSTTRAASPWPTSAPRSKPAWRASTRPWPASAAARTRRARAAAQRLDRGPRLQCSPAWASRPCIDIERLLALRAKVAGWLAGETLHGTLWRAGLPKTLRRTGPSRRRRACEPGAATGRRTVSSPVGIAQEFDFCRVGIADDSGLRRVGVAPLAVDRRIEVTRGSSEPSPGPKFAADRAQALAEGAKASLEGTRKHLGIISQLHAALSYSLPLGRRPSAGKLAACA